MSSASMQPVAVDLEYPVDFAGQKVTKLILTPSSGAFRGYTQTVSPAGTTVDWLATAVVGVRMAGMPDEFARALMPPDMMQVASAALGFMVPGGRTGPTS